MGSGRQGAMRASRNRSWSSSEQREVLRGIEAARWRLSAGEWGKTQRGTGRLSERGYHAESTLQFCKFTREFD